MIDIRLAKFHPAQRQVQKNLHRFNVVCCGRRWGKTKFGTNELIKRALDGHPVAWFSPTHKMLADVWRDVVNRLQPITTKINTQEKRIELITGGIIEFWSLENYDSIRGRKYALVIIDEAAMVASLETIWYTVIRPTLTDLEGKAVFLSTPRGRNFFWRIWQFGQDIHLTEWASWQFSTSTNPYIKASEIESARRELPERTFLQEYEAQFLDDAGGVFRGVRAIATLQPQEPIVGHQYIAGLDWGKQNDYTVLSVFDLTTNRQVYLDRFNKIEWALQRERVISVWQKYKPTTIVAERNSIGDPNIEALQRDGVPMQPFTTTNATKADIIERLSLAVERKEITLLDNAVQTAELEAYEMERTPSGLVKYGAPQGLHDDCVMATALAWYGASSGGIGVYI